MSGIKSTSGATPTAPVDTARNTAASAQKVAAVTPSTPAGGQSNSSVPHATSISSLSEGAMLAAVVTARASGGDTMLHTEVGNFRMAARSPIPVGSHVVLEVEAFDDLITARVIAINGEKLASPPSVTLLPIVNNAPAKPDLYALAALMATEEGGTEGKVQNITATLGQLSKVGSGETLKEIIGPQPMPTDRPSQAPHGNTNSALLTAFLTATTTSRSASSTAAAYAHTTATGMRRGTAPTSAAPNAAIMSASTGQQGAELVRATIDMPPINQRFVQTAGLYTLAAGNQLTLVASNTATASATVNPELQKNVATGTVISLSGPIGKGLGGAQQMQVHVQSSDLGSIRYLTSNPPAAGTQLNFALSDKLDQFPLAGAFASSGAFKVPHLPLMSNWENLRSSLNLLAAHDPALASIILNSRIPTANTNLGASLLFFLSALNGGNINKWLGQDVQLTLEKAGHADLFKSLSDDFTALSRLNSDAGGNDWKTLVFPFYSESRLQQLKMFYRKHSREGKNGAEDETRFIIELDLSKSGAVQLDGLFKPKQFDLLFRHQQDLDSALKARISEIFTENMEITGLSGSLTFRKDNSFPIHPTEEWEGRIHNSRDV